GPGRHFDGGDADSLLHRRKPPRPRAADYDAGAPGPRYAAEQVGALARHGRRGTSAFTPTGEVAKACGRGGARAPEGLAVCEAWLRHARHPPPPAIRLSRGHLRRAKNR